VRLAKIGDCDRVRVLQPAGGARFPAKPRAGCFVFDEPLIQNFDGDRPIDEQVARAINRAHSTDPQFFFQTVFLIECVTHEWINDGGGAERRIGLQRRFVLGAKLKFGRVLPTAFRAMEHMKTNDLGKQLALLPKQTVSGSEAYVTEKDGSRAGASPPSRPRADRTWNLLLKFAGFQC
jgi:hypothetical protein